MAAQREWFEKDYYKVLGVKEDAAPKDITKAYRKLARELHPDKNPGDAVSEERFKEVSAAYDVLGDETKRQEYDEVRRLGPMGGGGMGGGPGGFTFNVGDMQGGGGIGDLLGQMFGRGGRGGRAASGVGPQRGADVSAELTLDFADAVRGLTTTLFLTADAQCSTCHGSGAKPGTSPKVCSNCGGRGVVDDNQGMFSFSSPCRVCQGRGVVVEHACPTCRGSGIERRPREVQARIPAGVADGQTIRLKGRGSPGRNGGPAGDLLVEIKVTPHRHVRPFRQRPHREGADHVRRGGPRQRHRRADARRSAGHVADQAGDAERLSAPCTRQGHRRRQEERDLPPAT